MDATPNRDDLINDALSGLDEAALGERYSPPPESEVAPSVPSQALARLDKRRRPNPATVCESCPNSVWFTSPKEVKCYCRVMYLITWSTRDPNQITSCDGVFLRRDD